MEGLDQPRWEDEFLLKGSFHGGKKTALLDPGTIKFMKYRTVRFVKIMGQISRVYQKKL